MKELLEQVQKLTTAEYRRAAQKFGRANNGPHESYAVILEEYEEAIEEGKLFGWHMRCYWDAIKTNKKTKARLKHLQSIAEKAAAEWVQVAAMCYKAQQNKQTEKPELPEDTHKERVYISGPITGKETYWENFAKTEAALWEGGLEPVNPARIAKELPDSCRHDEYMIVDIAALSLCDAIYMMVGWESSKGARAEHDYAKARGMTIYYAQKDEGSQL